MAILKPSLDHHTTIPHVLQFHYENNPEKPIYVYAEDGQDIDNGLTEIKYLEFIRASHRAAHLIRPHRSGQDREVVAIIALADTIVYTALVVGVMQAGLIPLLISPRDTAAAVINLMKKTGAHRILGTQITLQELFQDIKVHLAPPGELTYDVTFDEIPGLDVLYPKIGAETEEDPFEAYPPASNYLSLDESAVILHSSGSTGLPKPIPLSHLCINKSWAQAATMTQFRDYCIGSMSVPGFHAMGFWLQILAPLYNGNSVATFPPVVKNPQMLPVQATPDNTIEHLRRTRSVCIAISTLAQVWVQSSSAMDVLRSLSLVMGGPMPTATGDYLVAQGVRFLTCYGGTEVGLPVSSTEREYTDWQWHIFADSPHIRWVPQGDGTFELQCLNTDSYLVSVNNLPDASGYATSDLWKPHPTKPGFWTIVGRIDDVIIHSSGEKTVPGPIEAIISSSPMLRGVVMFGRQRDQPGVLLEPSAAYQVDTNDSAQVSKFRDLIWPTVEEANKVAPAHSRLSKEMLLVVDHNKPLPRVGKGTVAGKAALVLYDAEIEKLYETFTRNSGSDSL